MDFNVIARTHEEWIEAPGQSLEPSFPREEYDLRIARARRLMVEHDLDALAITTHLVGHWFTSDLEPHEWHDRCQARSAWYILTSTDDCVFMTPTAQGEHFSTTRRSVWVNRIHGIAERMQAGRNEIWDIRQMPSIFAGLGLKAGRIGFELGDCMTLGMSFNDFVRLRELMPEAQLVDGSAVIRSLMARLTPLEVGRLRHACEAGVRMHDCARHVIRPGLTEREFQQQLCATFHSRYGEGYEFDPSEHWDIRNESQGELHSYHRAVTDRAFKIGDLVFRGASGVSYRGYYADLDRIFYLGSPPDKVHDWYRIAWECNRAMADAIRPGATCSDVYAAGQRVEQRYGLPMRVAGRTGHGYRNTGGLSVHPDCHRVLEPGMVLSVEPMFGTSHGFYDLEDQYVVTESGAEALHETAPEQLPVVTV